MMVTQESSGDCERMCEGLVSIFKVFACFDGNFSDMLAYFLLTHPEIEVCNKENEQVFFKNGVLFHVKLRLAVYLVH